MALTEIEGLVYNSFLNFLKPEQDNPETKQELVNFITDMLVANQEEEPVDPAFLSKKAYQAFPKEKVKESNFKNFNLLFELAYQFANKQLNPERLDAVYKKFPDDEKTKEYINNSLYKLYGYTIKKNKKQALNLVNQGQSQSAKNALEKIKNANSNVEIIINELKDYVKSHFFGALVNARLRKINHIISELESLQKYGEQIHTPVGPYHASKGKAESEGTSDRKPASNKEEVELTLDDADQIEPETDSQNERTFNAWRKDLVAKNYSEDEALKFLEFGTLDTNKDTYIHGQLSQFEDPVSSQLIDKAAMLLIDYSASASKEAVRRGAIVDESYALKCLEKQLADPVTLEPLADHFLVAQTDQSDDALQQEVNAFQQALDAFMQSAEQNYHKALALLSQETSKASQQNEYQNPTEQQPEVEGKKTPGKPSAGFFSQREQKPVSEEKPAPEEPQGETDIDFPEVSKHEPASKRQDPEHEPDKPRRGKLTG